MLLCRLRPQDIICGSVVVTTSGSLSHQGISLAVDGTIKLQLSARSVGLFEAVSSDCGFYKAVHADHPLAPHRPHPGCTYPPPPAFTNLSFIPP